MAGVVFPRAQSRRLFAVVVVTVLFVLMKLPMQPNGASAVPHFHFTKLSLAEVPGPEIRFTRPVEPEFKDINQFMSGIGAAAAINDLDGDGLPERRLLCRYAHRSGHY